MLKGENTVNLSLSSPNHPINQEEISDYVAHLQLHMTLQARNLVPHFSSTVDSRHQLLQDTQAFVEKLASRQMRA